MIQITHGDVEIKYSNIQKLAEALAIWSNHPHAAMIVEWVMTGKKVQFRASPDEIFSNCDSRPTWNPECEYRFKPESKPWYRVGVCKPGLASGCVFVVENDNEEITAQNSPNFIKWITDRTEYETKD